MIDKIAMVMLFPFYLSMRIMGLVVHDVLELREELGCPIT